MPSRYPMLSGTYFFNAQRKGAYSTHFHEGQIMPGAPEEKLYDLSKDVAQAKNIALEHPERIASMRARLEELTHKAKAKAAQE